MHPLTLVYSSGLMTCLRDPVFSKDLPALQPKQASVAKFLPKAARVRPFCGQNVVAQTHKLEITNTVPHIPDFTADTVKKKSE